MERRLITQCLGGTVQPTGGTTAHKPLTITVADDVHIGEMTARHTESWQEESIRVEDRQGTSLTAVGRLEGSASYFLTGKSSTNETDTPAVVAALCDALNALEPTWMIVATVPTRETGVDGVLDHDGVHIGIQVTRVGPAASRATLGAHGEARHAATTADALEWLREGVQKKACVPVSQRRALILALNARDFPLLPFELVVGRFRAKHGPWLRGFEFLQVWVIGCVGAHTTRLDSRGPLRPVS